MDGRLKQIENMLSNPKVEIYTCQQLLIEFESVINRPKIQKYLKPDRVKLAREAISFHLSSRKNLLSVETQKTIIYSIFQRNSV